MKEAMKLALEALEISIPTTAGREAMITLRQAIAEAEKQEQGEPVAWSEYNLDDMCEAFSRVIESQYQKDNPFHNPINIDAMMALRILRGFVPAMKAYTTQQRKPLTADDIKEPENGSEWRVEWWNESCRMMLPSNKRLDCFQSYKNGTLQFTIKEAAHGIKD